MGDIIQQLIADEKYEDALDLLAKQLEEHPLDDSAYYLRALLYKKLGKWGEAFTDLNKAIAINPNSQAVTLRQLLQEIADFRYNDILNP